ncbi:DUF2252 domain-containing protein [Pseudomonas sp. BGr12]|uniref:DUF2252 domain-containing protein n=1 Tax=unclassified Pseudomonas TaxID=196821 RepID=UPI0017850B57|nr:MULTISPECIES: DUF2252 domain-containing protein [unclassified Pseudomonas]MBD9500869.1 DUF2252 domain-containing protein [Pseudomonas sp. PDM17]MBD9579211.1 DUF2252 domain-containing protein [Pseudomonas sp. PDM23]MBD9672803.1 DUF2252 domain-containing protein [Pseudomonas sp. PDM21]MDL2428168.1 DUF2252 domain-containing protein [Pseudomonas sp. BJa5]
MDSPKKASSKKAGAPESAVQFRSREERLDVGRRLRQKIPRESHGKWKSPGRQRDVIAILEKSNRDRLKDLVPIRYGRMLRSPFTFLRGSAALMAHDLAGLPHIGVKVQACGDCHLLNFGFFATPERNLVFDLNDFDETLPAPWEWDIKRLAVSFAVAARSSSIADARAREIAMTCVRAYRENLRSYSRMSPLEVWYSRLDTQALLDMAPDAKARKFRQQLFDRARERVVESAFPKIAEQVAGQPRIIDQPPIIYHVAEADFMQRVLSSLADYRGSLSDDRRVLFERYRLVDAAVKVVGIGSVGTRCFIALLFSEENHPLILQFKESCRSVLEPYAGKCQYRHQGQRVVMGQRLMQSSSDIFLGWMRSPAGRDYFVRQLRDMKLSVPVERISAVQLERYADICGLTLARAHAKSGDAASISGYLGKGDAFDKAIGDFALLYADQTERDHDALVKAARSGRVKVLMEEE